LSASRITGLYGGKILQKFSNGMILRFVFFSLLFGAVPPLVFLQESFDENKKHKSTIALAMAKRMLRLFPHAKRNTSYNISGRIEPSNHSKITLIKIFDRLW